MGKLGIADITVFRFRLICCNYTSVSVASLFFPFIFHFSFQYFFIKLFRI
jgi:hypothetical protein